MRAPCQVFEKPPLQMVYQERGDGIWQALKCYHSPWLALNGCCYILVGLGWSPLFPDGLSIVAVISWWVLDACCYFLVGPGWLLLFPTVSWMVHFFLMGHGWLPLILNNSNTCTVRASCPVLPL